MFWSNLHSLLQVRRVITFTAVTGIVEFTFIGK